MYRLGIDLGGTKIEAILLAENGLVLSRMRLPTRAENGLDFILEQIIFHIQYQTRILDVV